MGLPEAFNYVLFDNPISQGVTGASKALFSVFQSNQNIKLPITPQITVVTERTPLWELVQQTGPIVRVAGVSGALAVALGAYGSHKSYPKDRAKELKKIFETANFFHLVHTVALFGVPMCKNPKTTGSLIVVGTIFFSGTCYYHAFTGENKFGRLAPIGGTILIISWLSMIF